jgi:long-chain acyl-CoA synthetase
MVTALRQMRVGEPLSAPVDRSGAGAGATDIVAVDGDGTLAGLFQARVRRSPDAVAYRHFDDLTNRWTTLSWRRMSQLAAVWQAALAGEDLQPGERVAVMLRNCPEWVMFEQAALGLGLAVVPLYTNDRPDNVAYILKHSGTRLLLVEGQEQWQTIQAVCRDLPELRRIVTLHPIAAAGDQRLRHAGSWLPAATSDAVLQDRARGADLATIVYTSGTTGRPKGVMLSHRNILWNARSALYTVTVYPDDVFLSFLPLSHALERTIGYYLAMMAGASVAYNRSVPQLADDLLAVRPTVLISVPRIFERVYAKIRLQLTRKPAVAGKLFTAAVDAGWRMFEYRQGRRAQPPARWLWWILDRLVARGIRAKLGGRLRVAVCGGAPLSPEVGRVFIGLGVPIIQGYGMTEASPVVCANALDHNDPASVGPPLKDVEVRIGEGQELQVRSPGVMMGYWRNPEATMAAVDNQGWLHTGDTARINNGFIYITGRLKEIVVLSNGEKVPHGDMELAIAQDPLFEQVLVVGEGRPYLGALVVVDRVQWRLWVPQFGLDPDEPRVLEDEGVVGAVMERISRQLHDFPGYAQIRRVALMDQPWSVENGMLTPTMKLRRRQILEHFASTVTKLYEGH